MVTTTTRNVSYTANGSTSSFDYNFLISTTGDLNVYVDGVLTTSGFTITGAGEEAGGAVVFSVAPLNLKVVLLQRDVPLTQPTNFPRPSLDPLQMEDSFDRLTLQLQDRATFTTMESNFATSVGVTQAGAGTGQSLEFNATGAPTITLPAGTWSLNGSVTVRCSDGDTNVWARFYDTTNDTAFGGGASTVTLQARRRPVSVSGVITVPVGSSYVVNFIVYPAEAKTLDVGDAVGPSGYMTALKIG
tara:strand:+ start:2820 stop:3554 length:735 start_codon:yes stop_codon:yes gene_type:complete